MGSAYRPGEGRDSSFSAPNQVLRLQVKPTLLSSGGNQYYCMWNSWEPPTGLARAETAALVRLLSFQSSTNCTVRRKVGNYYHPMDQLKTLPPIQHSSRNRIAEALFQTPTPNNSSSSDKGQQLRPPTFQFTLFLWAQQTPLPSADPTLWKVRNQRISDISI